MRSAPCIEGEALDATASKLGPGLVVDSIMIFHLRGPQNAPDSASTQRRGV